MPKVPANTQDVSHDKSLPSETPHSCDSHYHTRLCDLSNSACRAVPSGVRSDVLKWASVNVGDQRHAQSFKCVLCFACNYLVRHSGLCKIGHLSRLVMLQAEAVHGQP